MNDAAARERGFERSERRGQRVDAARDFGLGRHVHIVFGKVDAGFEQGDELNQRLLDGSDAAAERATHLAGGQARLGEGLRLDQVAHRLGLGEVEPAGEKGALGEFAGLGQPRAQIERAAKQQFQHDRRSMRGNLDEILGGVGVGSGEEGDQRFVDALRSAVRLRASASSTSARRARPCSSG